MEPSIRPSSTVQLDHFSSLTQHVISRIIFCFSLCFRFKASRGHTTFSTRDRIRRFERVHLLRKCYTRFVSPPRVLASFARRLLGAKFTKQSTVSNEIPTADVKRSIFNSVLTALKISRCMLTDIYTNKTQQNNRIYKKYFRSTFRSTFYFGVA